MEGGDVAESWEDADTEVMVEACIINQCSYIFSKLGKVMQIPVVKAMLNALIIWAFLCLISHRFVGVGKANGIETKVYYILQNGSH